MSSPPANGADPNRQAKRRTGSVTSAKKNNPTNDAVLVVRIRSFPMSEGAALPDRRTPSVTELLTAWCAGDESALAQLTPLVHASFIVSHADR